MGQLEIKTPYFDLYELIARYPRITARLTAAGFALGEAGAAIRDYRAGSQASGEAINYTGGTERAISAAYHRRHLQTINPAGWTAGQIRDYQTRYTITKAAAQQRAEQRAAEQAAERADWATRREEEQNTIERFYQYPQSGNPPDSRPRSTQE